MRCLGFESARQIADFQEVPRFPRDTRGGRKAQTVNEKRPLYEAFLRTPCTRPFRRVGGPLSGWPDGCAIDTGRSRESAETAFSGPPAGYKYSSPVHWRRGVTSARSRRDDMGDARVLPPRPSVAARLRSLTPTTGRDRIGGAGEPESLLGGAESQSRTFLHTPPAPHRGAPTIEGSRPHMYIVTSPQICRPLPEPHRWL